jgi:small subunit ribosomal protein S1
MIRVTRIVIVGNKDHPEVIGINGWSYNSAIITKDGSDLDKLPQRVCIVAQTTEKLSNYEKALRCFRKMQGGGLL